MESKVPFFETAEPLESRLNPRKLSILDEARTRTPASSRLLPC